MKRLHTTGEVEQIMPDFISLLVYYFFFYHNVTVYTGI